MAEGLVHVLIHRFVGRVEDGAFLLVHEPQEAVFGHALLLLGWWTRGRTERERDGENTAPYVERDHVTLNKTQPHLSHPLRIFR